MTLAYDMYMVAKEAAKEAAEVAAKEAFEDGFSAGEERGRNEGISIGLSQGISQGEKKAKIETAKSMKQENMSVSLIARFTGLTPEEIEKL